MSRYALAWIVGWMAAGCRFDPSGIAAADGAWPDTAVADAAIDGADIDSGSCPEPLHLALSIGGVTEVASPDQPFVRALVGDVVELSAAGSCAQQGTLSYQWQVSPVDGTRATAEPDLTSETVTIYPVLGREYVVGLQISNGADSMERTVLGVAAHDWVQQNGLPGGQDVRDVAAGQGSLWVAHKDGAYRVPLDAPADSYIDVNSEVTGDSIGNNLGTVYHHAALEQVWFGQAAARGDVWRVDLAQSPAEVTRVPYDGAAALGQAAEVLDIGLAALGVALATDQGLTLSADGATFAGDFEPADTAAVHAFAAGAGRHFGGGRRVYDLDGQGMAHDAFGDADADHQIRALAVDGDNQELWIGSARSGVARAAIAGQSFERLAVYRSATGTLATDAIRDLAVETSGPYAGDVWAATDAGVARYLRARDTWLLMGNSQGLNGRLDVRAIAIDQAGGRRAIYAGTKNGVVSLHVPE